jgi:hypothetical protein
MLAHWVLVTCGRHYLNIYGLETAVWLSCVAFGADGIGIRTFVHPLALKAVICKHMKDPFLLGSRLTSGSASSISEPCQPFYRSVFDLDRVAPQTEVRVRLNKSV